VAALVEAWEPGERGGEAVADVLFRVDLHNLADVPVEHVFVVIIFGLDDFVPDVKLPPELFNRGLLRPDTVQFRLQLQVQHSDGARNLVLAIRAGQTLRFERVKLAGWLTGRFMGPGVQRHERAGMFFALQAPLHHRERVTHVIDPFSPFGYAGAARTPRRCIPAGA
jgi:hypothetical protein